MIMLPFISSKHHDQSTTMWLRMLKWYSFCILWYMYFNWHHWKSLNYCHIPSVCHSLDSNQLTWNLPGRLKGKKLWGTVRALFSSNACSWCGLNLPLCSLNFHIYMWTMTSKDGVSFQLHPSAQIEGSIIFSAQFSSYYSVSQNCLGHACPQHKMLCHHCCLLVCLLLAFAPAAVRQLAWRTLAESPEAPREQRCDCKSRSVDTLTNCR